MDTRTKSPTDGLRLFEGVEPWRLRGLTLLERLRAAALGYPGFTVIVAIPTILAAIYYFLLAAPIYASYAQFEVKSQNQNPVLSGIGGFLQSTGVASTPNDAYTVDAFLVSRDALRALQRNPGIGAMYARPEADFLARFPVFFLPANFEWLWWHFTEWTEVDFDSDTNITTLSVYAFRPEDARAIADRLLVLGEQEVNRLNDRMRNDTLAGSRREVAELQARAQAIQEKITAFRNRELYLDPTETSTQSVTLLSTLESQLVSTRASLGQLEHSAPASPQIPSLRAQERALEDQVTAELKKEAGGSDTLAPRLAQYQQLLFEQQNVQTMLTAALTSLESAEATVQQQQLYVARVEEANLPDYPWYPYRIFDTFVVLVTLLLIYGIGRIVVAAVREHVY